MTVPSDDSRWTLDAWVRGDPRRRRLDAPGPVAIRDDGGRKRAGGRRRSDGLWRHHKEQIYGQDE